MSPIYIRLVLAAVLSAIASDAAAQSLGTFTWQLQPYCNRLTVNVTQDGAIYTLDGFDDQCGAPQRAPLVGMATPNPDGTVGLGFHIATSPGGRAVSVEARISLATVGGPWTDGAGNSGTLVLNGTAAGSPRPAPTVPGTVITAGSLPGTAIANGAVGTAQIAANAVTSAQIANEPGVNATFTEPLLALLPSTVHSVAFAGLRVPADGFVRLDVTGNWVASLAGIDAANCQLQKGASTAIVAGQPYFRLNDNNTATSASGRSSFSAHRVVPVLAADNPPTPGTGQSFRLVCVLASGAVALEDVFLSATYFPTSYAPTIVFDPPR